MTMEEAIQIASICEECFIVWHRDTGEILSVRPNIRSFEQPLAEFARNIQGMNDAGPVPTKGRWFESKNVTLDALREEAESSLRATRGNEILRAWALSPPETLLSILERRDYEQSSGGTGDAKIILDFLFKLHADTIVANPALHRSLRELQRRDTFNIWARFALTTGLAVMEGDADGLKAIYRSGELVRHIDWFMEPFGDVRTQDPEIIAELIDVVIKSFMSTPREVAMEALGKIGPSAGQRAADAIVAHIQTGSPHMKTYRDRVIARITSPANEWHRCTFCHRGYVQQKEPSFPWPTTCDICLGLGFVQGAVTHSREA